jgi:phage shock protein A
VEPIDLTNMDKKSAREYVVALLTTIKQTKAKKKELIAEVNKWRERVKLAEEKGRTDLRAEALQMVEEKQNDLNRIQQEERELERELLSAKSQLRNIEHQPQLSVDAEQLLAQLEMVVGEKDETEERFRDFQLDQALEELKRNMDKEGG